MIKRNIKKDFTERELWYIIKTSAHIFSIMQGNNIALGNISANSFSLTTGRFLKLEVLHLLPKNEHIFNINFNNYYSPEFLYQINENID